MQEGDVHEDLYQSPSSEWLVHRWSRGISGERPTLSTISEQDAVRWIMEWRQSKDRGEDKDQDLKQRFLTLYLNDPLSEHAVPHP